MYRIIVDEDSPKAETCKAVFGTLDLQVINPHATVCDLPHEDAPQLVYLIDAASLSQEQIARVVAHYCRKHVMLADEVLTAMEHGIPIRASDVATVMID